MKTFKIEITFTVPDNVTESEDFIDLKNSILSGEMQRELLEKPKHITGLDILKCKATFTEIK